MSLLTFIIGLFIGITIMCCLQINKLKNIEIYYKDNYIDKQKIKNKINELEYYSNTESPDVKIYTLKQAHLFAIMQIHDLI